MPSLANQAEGPLNDDRGLCHRRSQAQFNQSAHALNIVA